jgi:hypothetical protein
MMCTPPPAKTTISRNGSKNLPRRACGRSSSRNARCFPWYWGGTGTRGVWPQQLAAPTTHPGSHPCRYYPQPGCVRPQSASGVEPAALYVVTAGNRPARTVVCTGMLVRVRKCSTTASARMRLQAIAHSFRSLLLLHVGLRLL